MCPSLSQSSWVQPLFGSGWINRLGVKLTTTEGFLGVDGSYCPTYALNGIEHAGQNRNVFGPK